MPAVLAKNPATFDDLDFRVYSHRQWQDLHQSHAGNVIVHWPDGRTTQGLQKHIADLEFEEFLFWDDGEFMRQIGLGDAHR